MQEATCKDVKYQYLFNFDLQNSSLKVIFRIPKTFFTTNIK